MDTLNSVSQLLGLISLIAIIWIAVGAFRRGRISWGLGILFGPIIPVVIYLVYFWNFGPSRYHLYIILGAALITPVTAVFYALQFWDDVKKPFVVYMTSFVLSAGLGYYVFSTVGGWAMLRSSQNVARGIAQGDLTEADALKFMNSNLDMIENSGLSEEQRKKMDFMREFLKKAEGGFTEQEQRDAQRDFRNLAHPPDTSPTTPKDKMPLPAQNGQPDSRQASLKRTPVVQSHDYAQPDSPQTLPHEAGVPETTVIRFPRSGSDNEPGQSLRLAQVKKWIRRFVRVTPKKGVQQEGVLVEVSQNVLRLEKDMVAGFVTLPFQFDELESIELVR